MKNLDIEISKKVIGDEITQCVNARDLHKMLKSNQDFSTWIKKRLEEIGAIENEEYIKLHKKMELSSTGQSGIDYFVSNDLAKEFAMLEKNDIGRKVRRYFIQIEKEYKVLIKNIFALTPDINSIDYLSIMETANTLKSNKKFLEKEMSKDIQVFIKEYLNLDTQEIISVNLLYKVYNSYATLKNIKPLEFSSFVGYMALNDYHIKTFREYDKKIKVYKLN